LGKRCHDRLDWEYKPTSIVFSLNCRDPEVAMMNVPQLDVRGRFCLTAVIAVVLLVAVPVQAATPVGAGSKAPMVAATTGYPVNDVRIQVAGNLSVGISNNGFIGANPYSIILLDDHFLRTDLSACSPLFEFPAGTCRQHLYGASLWVGGIIEGDTIITQRLDARSAGLNLISTDDSLHEWSSLHSSAYYDERAIGHQQLSARYYDTIAIEDYQGRYRRSPGLEISQTSYTWISEPYDDFMIVTYSIKNISSRVINDAYVGVFADADVLSGVDGSTFSYVDDIAGYLPNEAIAYAIDNDGDPSPDSGWTDGSSRGAIGIAPLGFDPAPSCTTFNWWSPGYTDWGPLPDEPWNPPLGDIETYETMASCAIEPDQIWSTRDREPWWPPPRSGSNDVADGSDTRIMVAYGAFQLPPDDSILFSAAFVGGDSVHQDPFNFRDNFDAADPQPYYDNLYFGDLIRNTQAARLIYNNGFNLIGAAPPIVTFEPVSDTSVKVLWEPAPFYNIDDYRIYRRVSQDTTGWQSIGWAYRDSHDWIDSNIVPGIMYEYAVAATDSNGVEGFKSRPVSYFSGPPLVTPTIDAQAKLMEVALDWEVPSPAASFSPLRYLNIYRRTGDQDTAALYATLSITDYVPGARKRSEHSVVATPGRRKPFSLTVPFEGQFIDHNLESGIEYWYSASATNALGFESSRSDEVRAIPMALDRPGLMLVELAYRPGWPFSLIDPDSTIRFYFDWAVQNGFDTVLFRSADYPISVPWTFDRDSLFSLEHMSLYQTIIFVWEDREYGAPDDTERLAMENYMANGGRCILIGRNIPSRFNPEGFWPTPTREVIEYDDSSFNVLALGIFSSQRETFLKSDQPVSPSGYTISIQCVGAASTDPAYPDLDADSARALTTLLERFGEDPPIYGGGIIGDVGALLSFNSTDTLYTYDAGFPDTSSLEGLPVAIRSTNPDTRFVLFNFPLSLMKRPAAYTALDQALADLGVDVSAPSRTSLTQTILDYLYGKTTPGTRPALDTNHDGLIDLRDAVQAIENQTPNP
jgi:hypothetical protein